MFFFAWLKLILWKAFGFDSKKNKAKIPRKIKLSKRKQTLAKEKEKEIVEKKTITSGSSWTQ